MKDIIEISLAGFLHDWGKLFQRAETKLSDHANRMKEMLCPTYDGRSSHFHVLHTNDILENHLNWLPASLDCARIIGIASRHHRPADPEDWIIAEADRLASGYDRCEKSEEQGDFKSVPLDSVFASLQLSANGQRRRGILLPGILKADESLFPEARGDSSRLVGSYGQVVGHIIDGLTACRDTPEHRLCDTLASLSESMLARVPASTIDAVCDVSLHDHSAVVAAFAAALYAYHQQTDTFSESAIRDRSVDKFILLGGDLSGIQHYLFDMPRECVKGVARAYRARSFYLSCLTNAAAVKLLQELGLPSFSRVMDAGGRFILLVPNTTEVRGTVARVQGELDAWMIRRFNGTLTLNLDDSVSASGSAFMGNAFRSLLRRFQQATESSKRRKLAHALCDGDAWHEGSQLQPYAHGQEWLDRELKRDAELGRQLPRAAAVGLWQEDTPHGLLNEPVDLFGYQLQLLDKRQLNDSRKELTSVDFFAIRESSNERAEDASAALPLRSVARHIPKLDACDFDLIGPHAEEQSHPGDTATFEHLALLARQPKSGSGSGHRGLAAIACLKADVDRLGLLLNRGFRDDVSLGRIATLSRQLDYFFKAFLSTRLDDPESRYRHVYTVFAGGDDLLLVGPWPTMFDLAMDLQGWFEKLVAGNRDITLSAALAMGHYRMPVSTLADVAERALVNAKQSGRNRISAFGSVTRWPNFGHAMETGRRLDDMMARGDNKTRLQLRSGFVYRLLQYARSASRVEEARQSEHARADGKHSAGGVKMADLRAELTWRSHLLYDLHRNIVERAGKSPTEHVREDLAWLQNLLVKETKPVPDWANHLKLAATYALYRNRGG